MELHGQSRFQQLGLAGEKIINRAGYVEVAGEDEEAGLIYYVLPEVFRSESCAGFDHKNVTKALHQSNDTALARAAGVGSSLFGGLFNGIGFGKAAGSGGGLASLLPFLGVSLGSGLGDSSHLGQLVGGIGGGLLGIGLTAAPASFGTGGALASPAIAALFSNPFTAIAGVAARAGAFFIGRANQRKKDEATSGDYLQQAVDAIKDLKIEAEAGRLLSVGEARRTFEDHILKTFIEQINTIKTKSVRESRLLNPEITELLNGIIASGVRAEIAREELRRCIATTKAGKRCNGYAVWKSEEKLCASHLYKKRRTNAELEADPPVKTRRAAPTCDCPAYDWPHRRGKGYCRWLPAPGAIHPTKSGQRALGKKRRREWNRLREKLGL